MFSMFPAKFFAVALLVSIVVQAGCDRGLVPVDPVDSGIDSFSFELASVDGQTISEKDYANKVLVVDLWGTWCGPCRKEIPELVALQDELGGRGLQIVGINLEQGDEAEAIAAINEFTASVPVNYPLLLGTDAVTEQVPGFGVVPTKLVIDRTGKVVQKIEGALSKAELKAIVEPLL